MGGSKGSKSGGSTATSTKAGSSNNTKASNPKGSAGGPTGTKTDGSSKEVMKAPGQDAFIFRKDFESDPKTYFKGLRD